MKKLIPVIIIVTITIVSALRACLSGDDVVNDKKDTIPQIPIDRSLQQRIDSFVSATPAVGSLGMKVYDITAKRTIFSYRDTLLMRPASCLKLLTCITALRRMGPGYTYRTRLYTDGKMKGDTLVGDVILKTHFDPAFNRDSLIILLSALEKNGIKAIRGRVKLDVAFTTAMDHEEHWTMGDLKVSRMGLLYRGYGRLCREMLYALSAQGIKVTRDSIGLGRLSPGTAKEIACIRTPIRYAIEKALKNSSNINAEGLLYPLGYLADKRGNYRANGIEVLRQFISEELKLNPSAVSSLDDGCGLCPDNKLSPALIIALLDYAYSHKYIYNMVYDCLPLSGTDGTLYDRLRKPNVVGKIKAKTGTLTREGGISSLSGYFTGADGHLIAFSIINNECPVMDGRWWQDKFLTKIIR